MRLYVVRVTRVDNPPIVAIFKTAKDAGACAALACFAAGAQPSVCDIEWWQSKWRRTTAKGWSDSLKTIHVDMMRG